MIITQGNINKASDAIVHIAFAGAVGYWFAHTISIINPVYAAGFCAFTTLVSKIASTIFETLLNGSSANNSAKALAALSAIAIGGTASVGVAALATVSIAFKTAVILTYTALTAKILIEGNWI